MNNPKITIVTPSYNQQEFIEETILSVINQDYKNIEFIIIDGGSTDGSVDTIQKYEKSLSFWISRKDDGQSDAIHKGFKMATGDIVCWLNSDDFFIPGALTNVAKSFEKNPTTDILLGDGMYSDVNSNIIKYYRYTKPHLFLAKQGVIAYGQQSMFFNRKFYLESGGLLTDFHYCMDSEFIHRAIKSRSNFTLMHYGSGVFRWHEKMKSLLDKNLELKGNKVIERKLIGGRKAEEKSIIANKYYSNFSLRKVSRFIYTLIQLLNGNYILSYLKTMKLKHLNLKLFLKKKK